MKNTDIQEICYFLLAQKPNNRLSQKILKVLLKMTTCVTVLCPFCVYLRDCDSTLFGEFLFGFFTGVWVGQVGVEILIQDLCGLLAEVAPLAPDGTQIRNECWKYTAVCSFH